MINIPGTEIMLNGAPFILAPLNVAAVKQFREQIKAVFVGSMPDIELVSTLALASLKRNYPEIKAEFVDQGVDYGNLFDIWESLLNLSGMAVSAGNMVRRVQQQMDQATTGSTT
jgi:hypothetical protein